MKQYIGRATTYLFYAFIFLLPWQTRWIWREGMLNGEVWEYGRFSLYGWDILWLLLFIGACIVGRRAMHMLRPWWWMLGVLTFFGLLSVLTAQHQPVSVHWFLRLAQGVTVVWIVQRIHFRWGLVSISFVAAGVMQACLAIYQFFSQSVVANTWLGMAAHAPGVLGDIVVEADGGRFLRAYGSFPHPNILAGFLVLCLIMTIGLLIVIRRHEQTPVSRVIVTVTSFVLLYYALILTFSRSAWLAFIIVVASMIILAVWQRDRYRLRVLTPILLWIGLVSLFSVILLPELIAARSVDPGRLEVQSSVERFGQYQASADLIRDYWLDGVGIGSSTYALYELDSSLEAWDYQPIHNIFALAVVELGIFGGLLWLALHIRFLWTAFVTHYLPMKVRHGFFMMSCALFSLIIISIFDHYLWSLVFGIIIWWLVFGLWLRKYSEISVDK